VFRPHSIPIYSNTAFRILSYALEIIANKTFEDIMEESVFKPLGLNNTSIRKPDKDSLGVIPQGQSMWFYDIGDESA
jgi:CubicO group peptidase (beta-lactamase class C family)